MTNDLVVYSEDQIKLIKETVAKDCTETEFALLMQLARTYTLDPFSRQIWAIKYGNSPAQIFCGRDGYLAIAHRSGQFDGFESGTRKNDDGEIVGWCKVWRKDMARPFCVEARMSEYNTKKSLWASKPFSMITKVAESQALRKAFSISGLYSPEEFDDAPQVQQAHRDSAPRFVCAGCGLPVADDDKLAKIREHSGKDMCYDCFVKWHTENKEKGDDA